LAQHISRRELKTDEVRETIAHGAEAVLLHKQATTYILVIAVLVAGAILGWRSYSAKQTSKASAAFAEAMQVFQAPLANQPGPPPLPGQPSYADEKAKFAAAAQKFKDVAKEYGHTRPGQLANYYAGLSLERLGQNDEARRWLAAAANGGDADYAALAHFELAQNEDKTGQGNQAVKVYQELLAKPSVLVPKPLVMLALAEHYRQGNPSEAAKLYGQIKAEYPDTAISQQADQELALLPGKS
jgi:predicted negative regulator of RcsB-dependent stress response